MRVSTPSIAGNAAPAGIRQRHDEPSTDCHDGKLLAYVRAMTISNSHDSKLRQSHVDQQFSKRHACLANVVTSSLRKMQSPVGCVEGGGAAANQAVARCCTQTSCASRVQRSFFEPPAAEQTGSETVMTLPN